MGVAQVKERTARRARLTCAIIFSIQSTSSEEMNALLAVLALLLMCCGEVTCECLEGRDEILLECDHLFHLPG